MGHMGLVSEKYQEGLGSFLDSLVLRWGMVLRLDFGMMYGVGTRPLR
jgi:hypothetical protein